MRIAAVEGGATLVSLREKIKIFPDPEERRPYERRAKERTEALRLRLGA